MSGGRFGYDQDRVKDIAVEIDKIIAGNDKSGEQWAYPHEVIEKFRETSHTLRQAAEMAQRVDWLVSGDDGDESFLKRWDEEVRPYWQDNNKDITEKKPSKKPTEPINLSCYYHPNSALIDARETDGTVNAMMKGNYELEHIIANLVLQKKRLIEKIREFEMIKPQEITIDSVSIYELMFSKEEKENHMNLLGLLKNETKQ